MAGGGQWTHPIPAPDVSARCSDGRTVTLADLHDKIARVVAGDGPDATAAPQSPVSDVITIRLQREARADSAGDCTTGDPAAWSAYAIVSGVAPDALAGTQVLVDPQGWLRARGTVGEPSALIAEIAQIRANPIAAPVERGHLHQH
jgi:hypothetical protein